MQNYPACKECKELRFKKSENRLQSESSVSFRKDEDVFVLMLHSKADKWSLHGNTTHQKVYSFAVLVF